jgi:hypothetical protein
VDGWSQLLFLMRTLMITRYVVKMDNPKKTRWIVPKRPCLFSQKGFQDTHQRKGVMEVIWMSHYGRQTDND